MWQSLSMPGKRHWLPSPAALSLQSIEMDSSLPAQADNYCSGMLGGGVLAPMMPVCAMPSPERKLPAASKMCQSHLQLHAAELPQLSCLAPTLESVASIAGGQVPAVCMLQAGRATGSCPS